MMKTGYKQLLTGWAILLLLVGLPLASQAHGKKEHSPIKIVPGEHQKIISLEKLKYLIGRFESKERVLWQKPGEILESLVVKPGAVVADIGAGTGYFTHRFSKMVGSAGKVYAVDIDPGFIEYLEKRKDQDDWQNVTVHKTPYDDPQLPDKSCDIIFFADVWHHVSNRDQYLHKLYKALKDDGRLVIVDFRYFQLAHVPPLAHRIPREQVMKVVRENGFKLHGEFFFLPKQYFLIFKKVLLPS